MAYLIWQFVQGLTTKGLAGGHQSSMGPAHQAF